MDVDVDTFLTTVYVTVDDFCAAHPAPIRPGPKPVMSDSEVLTILLLKPGMARVSGVPSPGLHKAFTRGSPGS